MDPAVWARIKDLALEAMDRDSAVRGAFLNDACGDDVALRAEVEKLIGAYDAADREEFLDAPPAEAAGGGVARALGEAGALVGARIGRYRVRRLIGVGGMGAVYEAVQEQPRRTVALKVMRSGLASRSAMRRFEYESQLLARLRHPGIAQVYEAGAHEGPPGGNGAAVPYFAMEYIPGAKPITEYAREKKLGVRERAELVARVCEAVHHGHQKGIVHRDLKPTNILVDSSGSPKIIDFGVARATDSDLAVTTLQTDVGQLIGTLQYMSPEQCVADPTDIDTRSDVYSLGVVLYELLTGKPPYDLSKVPVYEAPRIIREETPARPSAIDPALRGDLQIIVLKALEKDRAQRYQSAAELGLDLKRYLEGEAIAARPPSVLYQVRVLAARHRTLVTSAMMVVLALAVGCVVAGVGLQRAIQARDLARTAAEEAKLQAARAERIADFLKRTIGSVDPTLATANVAGGIAALDPEYAPWEVRRQSSWEYAGTPGQAPTAADLLRAAARRMEQTFSDDPSIRAELSALIGTTLAELGATGDAVALLKSAIELQRRMLGERHEQTIATLLELATTRGIVGDFAEAEESFREACEGCRVAFGPVDPRTLQAVRQRTFNLAYAGQREEALRQVDEISDTVARRLGADDVQAYILMAHKAGLIEVIGRPGDAEPLARKAVAGLTIVAGRDRRSTIDAMATLAHILRTLGGKERLIEAEALQRGVVRFYETRINPDYGSTLELRKSEAEMLMLLGRPAEAAVHARAILNAYKRVLGPENLNTYKSESRLARAQIAAGADLEEAEALARHSAEWTPRTTAPAEDYAVYHVATWADSLRRLGRIDEAMRECDRLLVLTQAPGARNAGWVLAYLGGVRGQCLTDLGRHDEAREVLKKAMADADGWGDPGSAIRIGVIRAGEKLEKAAGREDEATRWHELWPIP